MFDLAALEGAGGVEGFVHSADIVRGNLGKYRACEFDVSGFECTSFRN